MKNIKAIFFDAGGTLIHLDSSHICGLISAELGASPSPDNFRRAQYLAMRRVAELVAEGAGSTEKLKAQFYSTLLPEIGVPADKLQRAVECVLKLAQAEMLWRKADESTALTLRELKERGLTLGVVSNSDGRIENAFEQAGLSTYFDFFIDSFLVGVEKPDPKIFHIATERAAVAPSQAAYVGDLYSVDVVGARDAGLLPILYDPYELNPQADCIRIRMLGDLLGLVDGVSQAERD
ncbi:MAG TPA: HAD-IA family hydrolase [Blastocatellia bacterium]|nr:HAD-IA family hydrolase [Blastocatellia bacterium]